MIDSGRQEDLQIVNSRWVDLTSYILVAGIGGTFLNKFTKKLDIPFFSFLLEEKSFNYGTFLRRGIIGTGIVAFLINSTHSIVSLPFMWDLALKYKEDFAQGELVSPNCESEITKH